MTTTTTPTELDETLAKAHTEATTRTDDLTQRARAAAGTASSAASSAAEDLSARIPEAATEVNRLIRSGSNDTLRMVTVGIVGFAIGLLVGGANRLLIMAALIPAGMIGLVLSGRRSA